MLIDELPFARKRVASSSFDKGDMALGHINHPFYKGLEGHHVPSFLGSKTHVDYGNFGSIIGDPEKDQLKGYFKCPSLFLRYIRNKSWWWCYLPRDTKVKILRKIFPHLWGKKVSDFYCP